MEIIQCGRIGCTRPAVGVLLIAAQEQRAWLVALGHESAFEGVPLCHEHADRISVPAGWALSDERAPAPTRRRRSRRASRAAALPFDDLPLDDTLFDAEPSPEPPLAEPAPHLAVVEDLPVVEEMPVVAEMPVVEDLVVDVPMVDVADGPAPVPETSAVEPPANEPPANGPPADDAPANVAAFPVPAHRELEATERTPLLQRAFRLAHDD